MIEVLCPERLEASLQKARDHSDTSLQDCLDRLRRWSRNEGLMSIVVGSDYDEDCFSFREVRKDGRMGINGGIIFHGFRETGYRRNGSVQLAPSYGWQIHT